MIKHYYWGWDRAIPKSVCEAILNEVNTDSLDKGVVFSANKNEIVKLDEKVRKSKIVWQNFLSPAGCIAQAYIAAANSYAGWNYDLTSQESVQISRYEEGDFYNWHVDLQPPNHDNTQRKLTFSMVLSDDFEGGELEIEKAEKHPVLKQGSIVVFPSFLSHRVAPVLKGVRYSAVTWASGPAFR